MLQTLIEISEGSAKPTSDNTTQTKQEPEVVPEVQPKAAAEPQADNNEDDVPLTAPLTAALAVDTSSVRARRNGSGNGSTSDRGPETESDDGVLVDRPETPSA